MLHDLAVSKWKTLVLGTLTTLVMTRIVCVFLEFLKEGNSATVQRDFVLKYQRSLEWRSGLQSKVRSRDVK